MRGRKEWSGPGPGLVSGIEVQATNEIIRIKAKES